MAEFYSSVAIKTRPPREGDLVTEQVSPTGYDGNRTTERGERHGHDTRARTGARRRRQDPFDRQSPLPAKPRLSRRAGLPGGRSDPERLRPANGGPQQVHPMWKMCSFLPDEGNYITII